jgi:recombination protein RecR
VKTPRPIEKLINSFQRLPGIGPKTAQRLVFTLLHFPQEEIENFSDHLKNLKLETKMCSICKNVDEFDPCSICKNDNRNSLKIIVTSSPLDVFAFEKVGHDGRYHVLHGVINPLDNIGPDELYIKDLITRLKELASGFDVVGGQHIELILATNTSMEGESTAMYISKLIRDEGFDDTKIKITRIARGLPVGGDIEYADDITLTRALEGRVSF